MIEIEHLTKRYGATIVVDDVSLRVDEGTITVVVGTSGAGKSTLLRMINRLVEPSEGRVLIDGQDTMAIPEDQLRHRIGYVIQGYGLFPHRDVAENIATVPRLLGWDKRKIAARVEELLDLFQLDPAEFAKKFPHELSGGQQQRVGVARALAAKPAVLLMDEPFGALDPVIRSKAQDDLVAIQRRLGTTVVLVTHDMNEAFQLGDRIAVMDQARLLQYATPAELLTRPAEAFVEQLVGTAERPFRLLSLLKVREALEPGHAEGEPVLVTDSLRDALSRLIWAGREALPVADASGALVGRVSVRGIVAHGRSVP
ncbi:ABC transporter ATP-binding protein [Microvirga lotononidis]|uniref:ABC-type proline/glycine betaine transport system, ATPase component n=1 Tax=Microvirga lotononidis TaxID=864069 RepID=I4YMR6_9HYPH|nr:ABC transporter ATP-binding protein [Microvirga lotononidis]EIM25258.1 ABC-type proline/glycine betaine transport system, ATPase component [Microvirga lotononidis]WQO29263.1 ABC transporter ATP-binding protein [Microvirga lotononidis]